VLRLAVTGGVASGKSTVLAALADQGVATIDLDRLCRELVEPGRPALERIRREFGEEFLAGGALDRARMRRLISRDEGARRRLNAILHPAVVEAMEERLAELAAAGQAVAAVEVALLFEAGYGGRFDAVIVAACPREVSLGRLMARSGLSREEAELLLAAQLSIEDKIARADFVVDTTGAPEDARRQVEQILQKLRPSPSRRLEGG
jgi:dephospho-CoA kinase